VKRQLDEMQAFRAQELLMQRATEGLSDAEAAELAALGADDDVSYDLAAAAIDIATIRIEDMPAGVADKILVSAGVKQAGFAPTTLPGIQMPSPRPTPIPQQAPPPSSLTGLLPAASGVSAAMPVVEAPIIPIAERAKKRSRAPMIVAWTAAAAGIALGAGAFLWASNKAPEVITEKVYVEVAKPTPAQARKDLLAAATDVKTLAWTATTDPFATGAAGDVVWSPSKQEGYMRFTGLATNDPKLLQYQLWIFDKDRDDKYPVDGGVFDVGPDGEVVVKISPKLRVNEPVLFAVTVEAPGGVVVSKRERIVVTAAPPKTG
jgi:hypothetical protein